MLGILIPKRDQAAKDLGRYTKAAAAIDDAEAETDAIADQQKKTQAKEEKGIELVAKGLSILCETSGEQKTNGAGAIAAARLAIAAGNNALDGQPDMPISSSSAGADKRGVVGVKVLPNGRYTVTFADDRSEVVSFAGMKKIEGARCKWLASLAGAATESGAPASGGRPAEAVTADAAPGDDVPAAPERAAAGEQSARTCCVVLGRGSKRAGQVCGKALPCRRHQTQGGAQAAASHPPTPCAGGARAGAKRPRANTPDSAAKSPPLLLGKR